MSLERYSDTEPRMSRAEINELGQILEERLLEPSMLPEPPTRAAFAVLGIFETEGKHGAVMQLVVDPKDEELMGILSRALGKAKDRFESGDEEAAMDVARDVREQMAEISIGGFAFMRVRELNSLLEKMVVDAGDIVLSARHSEGVTA